MIDEELVHAQTCHCEGSPAQILAKRKFKGSASSMSNDLRAIKIIRRRLKKLAKHRERMTDKDKKFMVEIGLGVMYTQSAELCGSVMGNKGW